MTKTLAIITAGGIGRRFSDETLKQLAPYDQNLSVLDKTCLLYTSPSPRDY